MLLCAAKEALVKQTAFISTFCTEVSPKLFYSLIIMFFPTNSLDKASKLLFIFVRVSRGYAAFPTRRDRLFLVVYEACTVVFQLLTLIKPEGKVIHEVGGESPHPYFRPPKKNHLRAKFTCAEVYYRLRFPFNDFAHVGAYRQT